MDVFTALPQKNTPIRAVVGNSTEIALEQI